MAQLGTRVVRRSRRIQVQGTLFDGYTTDSATCGLLDGRILAFPAVSSTPTRSRLILTRLLSPCVIPVMTAVPTRSIPRSNLPRPTRALWRWDQRWCGCGSQILALGFPHGLVLFTVVFRVDKLVNIPLPRSGGPNLNEYPLTSRNHLERRVEREHASQSRPPFPPNPGLTSSSEWCCWKAKVWHLRGPILFSSALLRGPSRRFLLAERGNSTGSEIQPFTLGPRAPGPI